MAEIKAIEGRSIHQIQSGQVISDGLCSAVKELIENSIDAHATSIEVRFKNSGLELIEVSDNGGGITPDNFDKLALKHYTSKLRTYEDLERVTTYGFRGEALSSLCALSNLWVTTATADVAPKGTKIEFHTSGVLRSTSVTSHPRGTTVSVEQLFKNLPVRKQELERNIKREFTRVVSFLQAYAIVCIGVKFTVYNHPPNGKKTLLFSTKANKTTKENIANVFGAKALANLIPLDLDFEMTATVSILNRNRDDTRKVKIVGHISRPVFGEGRQAPDRQLFFVNSRPCNLPQVARAINEVYKSYNLTQSPFVFADLQLDTTAYDVNVSPDKRTILLHDQANLLESLKTSLTELFDNQDQTVPAASQSKLGSFKSTLASTAPEPSKAPVKRPAPRFPDDDDDDESEDEVANQKEPKNAVIRSASRSRDGSEDLEPTRNAFSSLMSRMHRNSVAGSSGTDDGKKSKGNLTYEQKGKIAKAFAARQPSHVDGDEDESARTPVSGSPEPEATAAQDEDEETGGNPLSQASPKTWRKSSPHPTTVTIGNRTVSSTPKRSPSKVFPVISSSSPSRRVAGRNQKGSFAKRLQGFGASGTPSSFSIPEDDVEESDEELAEVTQQEPSQEPVPERDGEEGDGEGGDTESIPRRRKVGRNPSTTQPGSLFLEDEDEDEDGGEGETVVPDLDRETETQKPGITVSNSEPVPSSSVRAIPPSSPPLTQAMTHNQVPPEIVPIINDENGTEQQHRERERRTVDRLIVQAEESVQKPVTPQVRKLSTSVKNDLKDSTHCLVQKLQPYTMNNIRFLSKGLRPPAHNNEIEVDLKGKKGKLVELDAQEERAKVEERLSLTIAKSDFGKMQIAGQFNLGFILATRQSEKQDDVNDLFIIDQHASDEKYNFERLQAETVVQNQPLVRPKVLELSAMDELVVMDNMNVLKKNGFVVEVDDEGLVGKRCRLVSLPMSKDKVFDLKDFEELLHLIREHPNDDSVRPSKVRAMFAMRACRSSIMIGRTLGFNDMKKVVKHMGELDKPWNCPHGRPTMRHLCDVGQLECWQEDMERAFAESEAVLDNGDEVEGESEGGGDEEYVEEGEENDEINEE
ncbi:hypothetical protein H072_2507 [Dactylellina haptotyla CBS 200.50]|uniref:DNA mismatch repair protein PMS1 n=1 Tax=Dactylellina haptotyla (strain CBS 200.50) TaxID=1284197 RepID=S8AKJ3_DACHA|nr:hypothetical protein H072_2507 [Dactylellina haptotyla CBS 200.50]